MNAFWDDLWKREREFHQSGARDLRHGISAVGVSTIAGQYYCEYKVENEFVHGEMPTEAKEEGTVLHEELMPLKSISKDDLVKLVKRRGPTYAVLPVWGKLAEIRLTGVPDHIIWAQEKPKWLVELKTTAGDPTPLWNDQRAQILIYGALLEKMGFDCSGLRLALVRLKSGALSEEKKAAWTILVSRCLESDRVEELERRHDGGVKVHLIKHDALAAEACVREMQGYWLEQRDPISSKSVNKCRACEYHSLCPKSLFSRS